MADRLILITNDDGILAPGLEALAAVASKFGKAIIVAPDRNRSAISSAMSIHSIIRMDEIGPDRYSCDGTPVDCVLMGVRQVLDRTPDWILSGVNWGFNLAEDALYSGTVGAAFEGRLQGVRSVAFSLERSGDLKVASIWIERFLAAWEAIELPTGTVWNVNMPEGNLKGFRMTAQGSRNYFDLMERRLDPRGRPYFWIGGEGGPYYSLAEGTDTAAVHEGFVSITPLNMNLTCREAMARRSEYERLFGS
ncbi:MAG: 5'/3'-nucleotidase SurE [Holophagaceae bacterium]|nr:5'/3'-nucleotidase SurE [Holophagaceae bacterium]